MRHEFLLAAVLMVIFACFSSETVAAAQQPSAFNDKTYFTTSPDGLSWSEGILLAERASVPEVIRTSQGVLWAYWVDFSGFTGPGTEKIGVAWRPDGAAWETLGQVNFTDIGTMVPVDPDVVELADGRLRMYFYDISPAPRFHRIHRIHSAISSDGLNFTLEEGIRFEGENVFDPDVILLPDGRFRMYLNSVDILSATSPDGLTFTLDEGVRVERGAVPGSIVLPDGSVRLYCCSRGISAYVSIDGLAFSLERESVIRGREREIVCDPSVTATPDGYLLVYKTNQGQ